MYNFNYLPIYILTLLKLTSCSPTSNPIGGSTSSILSLLASTLLNSEGSGSVSSSGSGSSNGGGSNIHGRPILNYGSLTDDNTGPGLGGSSIGFLLDLYEGIRKFDETFRDKTFNYGMNIVTKPLDELTFADKLIRAALSPRKYYQEVERNYILNMKKVAKVAKKLHLNEASSSLMASAASSPSKNVLQSPPLSWFTYLLKNFPYRSLAKS